MKINLEFDNYAKNYFKEMSHPLRNIISKDGDYFIEAKYNIIKDAFTLIKNSKDGFVAVDIGTGLGLFEHFFNKENIKIFALDLSFNMLKIGQLINPLKLKGLYFQGDALSIPLHENFSDIVFASCVFHHLLEDEIRIVLKEMTRICKQNGLIIVFEHNPYNIITKFVVKTTKLDRNANLLKPEEIIKMMGVSKLNLIEVKYFLYGNNKVDAWVEKRIPFASKFPLGGQFCIIAKKR